MKAIVKSIGSKHSYFDYAFKVGEEFNVSTFTETKDIKLGRMFRICVPGIGTELFWEHNCNELDGGNWKLIE